ncbi:MAG: hypothetical protein ACOC1F_05730 [Myxococcota bacterium]
MLAEIITGVVILLAGWGGVAVYFRFRSRGARTRRLLQRRSRVPIAALQDGVPSKISGRLRYASEPLRAALTGRPCAVWEIEIEELTADRESIAPVWQPFIVEQDARDFHVDDESGSVLVHTAFVRVTAVKDAQFWSGLLRDAPPQLEAYLQRHGERSKGKLGLNRTIRYREGVLEAGEQVTVLGVPRAEDEPGVAHDYREQQQRLVMHGPADGFVVVSDAPDTQR